MTKIDTTQINIHEIMQQLPHRYPFLMIDRILSVELGKQLTALKNVSINEPFFVGHFPEMPVMPGVLIVEAMAQAAGILAVLSHGPRQKNELYFFASIDKAKFKRQVIPGDQLILQLTLLKNIRGMAKFQARAIVANEIATEAEIMIAKRSIS